jgi:hypothetical protein
MVPNDWSPDPGRQRRARDYARRRRRLFLLDLLLSAGALALFLGAGWAVAWRATLAGLLPAGPARGTGRPAEPP